MSSELQGWIDSIEDGRRLILQEVGQLPPQARSWRPHRSSWSSLEVVHHLALVENLTVKGLERPLDPDEAVPGLKERIGRLAVRLVFRLGLRVRIPTSRFRPDPGLGLHAVEEEWEEARDRLLGFYRTLDRDRTRVPVIRHPVAGPLDALQTLEFLASHQTHHRGQLHRLRSAPGFPWNP